MPERQQVTPPPQKPPIVPHETWQEELNWGRRTHEPLWHSRQTRVPQMFTF
jgi:hypothetical protein